MKNPFKNEVRVREYYPELHHEMIQFIAYLLHTIAARMLRGHIHPTFVRMFVFNDSNWFLDYIFRGYIFPGNPQSPSLNFSITPFVNYTPTLFPYPSASTPTAAKPTHHHI